MSRYGVICLGEAMGEIAFSPDGENQIGVGGDTFNTAIYLARAGVQTAFASVVGDDPFGFRIRAALDDNGVDDTLLREDKSVSTGLYSITNDATGERFFHYWRDSSAARTCFAAPPADWLEGLCDTQILYLSGISLYTFGDHLPTLFDLLERARDASVRIAFDGNYRPRLWAGRETEARAAFGRMLDLAQIVLPTFEDEVLLWQDSTPEATLDRIAAHGPDTIVLKRGPDGCIVRHAGQDTAVPIPNPVTVVDTTAAGDSFNAGFLAAHLQGTPLTEAALAGHILAARVIGHRGALIPKGM